MTKKFTILLALCLQTIYLSAEKLTERQKDFIVVKISGPDSHSRGDFFSDIFFQINPLPGMASQEFSGYCKEIGAFVHYKDSWVNQGARFKPFEECEIDYLVLNCLKDGYLPCNFDFFGFASSTPKVNKNCVVKVIFCEAPPRNLFTLLQSDDFRNAVSHDVGFLPKLFLKIAKLLDNLHKIGIIHRNLNLSNVFVFEGYEPMILDFGSCWPLRGHDPIFTLSDDRYDWHIFGMLIVECAQILQDDEPNFASWDDEDFGFLGPKESASLINQQFKDLVRKLTTLNVENRLRYRQIIEHPYFKDVVTAQDKMKEESFAPRDEARILFDEYFDWLIHSASKVKPSSGKIFDQKPKAIEYSKNENVKPLEISNPSSKPLKSKIGAIDIYNVRFWIILIVFAVAVAIGGIFLAWKRLNLRNQ